MATVLIDKNDSRLKAVKFLTSCMNTKDIRFHIHHFKVENDGSAVSTDGKRLHFVNELPLEAGYYEVHKNNKTSVLIEKKHDLESDDASYPQYEDLLKVPDGNGEISENCLFSENSGYDPSSVYTIVIRHMTKSTLNFNYVNDIYNALEGDAVVVTVPAAESFNDRELETCQPVHFTRNGFHAVVMPKKV